MNKQLSLLTAIYCLSLASCSSSTSTLPGNPATTGTNKILYQDLGTPVDNKNMTVRLIDRDGSNMKQLDTGALVGTANHHTYWQRSGASYDDLLGFADSNGLDNHTISLTTNVDDQPAQAVVSPDGSKIVCPVFNNSAHTHTLLLKSTDGSTTRVLAQDAIEYSPIAFSPDGKSVVYYGTDESTQVTTIRTISLDGGVSKQIAIVSRYAALPTLDWSVKNRIVFADNKTLHVVGSDGGGLTNVGEGSMAVWSPDGSKLAFSTSDFRLVVSTNEGVTQTEIPVVSGAQISFPQWSPDGKYLLVGATWSSPTGLGRADLYEVSVASITAVKVVSNSMMGYYVK